MGDDGCVGGGARWRGVPAYPGPLRGNRGVDSGDRPRRPVVRWADSGAGVALMGGGEGVAAPWDGVDGGAGGVVDPVLPAGGVAPRRGSVGNPPGHSGQARQLTTVTPRPSEGERLGVGKPAGLRIGEVLLTNVGSAI